MSISKELIERSNNCCELCNSNNNLLEFKVEPKDEYIVICENCQNEMKSLENPNYFRVLNDTMWSQIPAVQVAIYRILKSISSNDWSQDMIDMLYLEPEVLAWANDIEEEEVSKTKDSNGTILNNGDSVTIIKDLDVKGAGFTAKRGTVVKNISLTNNEKQIEGRVNGVKIVLLSCFLKKV